MEDKDLNHLLDQAADPPPASADSFRHVMDHYRRGRTRTLLAALVAVALVGPAAGIAVGRATKHRPVQVATGAQPKTADSAASTESHSTVYSSGTTDFQGSSPAPPKRLFVRTTADGVTIRAYLQDSLPIPTTQGEATCASNEGTVPCPPPPPADCFPNAQLQAELSDAGAVEPGFIPVVTADDTGPVTVVHASYFGVMEGDPAAWVVVKTGVDVAKVRVHFSDGIVDEMAPVEGYAVLAHRTPGPAPASQVAPKSAEEVDAMRNAWMPQGSAEAFDAGGTSLATAELASVTGPISTGCAIAEPGPLLPHATPPAPNSTAPAPFSVSPPPAIATPAPPAPAQPPTTAIARPAATVAPTATVKKAG